MPLKFKVETIEEVEEAFRSLYKVTKIGDADVHILQVEGAVPVERLAEAQNKLNTFRKTNGRLAERLKVLTENAGIQLEDDITPEDLADLLKEKRQELEDSLKGKGKASKEDIEGELVKRVEMYKSKHDAELKKIQDEKLTIEQQLSAKDRELAELAIGQEIMEAGSRLGMLPKASRVIVGAALKTFKRVDGKTRCLDDENDPIRGSDGISEQTVADWLENVALKEYDFAFEKNSGGGATGSGGAGRNGGSGPNPFKKESWNTTQQLVLLKKDPATARRMAQEAGATIPAGVPG